ncbi:hypothetical protein [Compostibacter hankyongensis]|uniref:DUF222 domain-containing protein n=1 Tax=Compostibacter hankyongensis TaxID=1007089 RepID=A0ABP8FZ00_9BACT
MNIFEYVNKAMHGEISKPENPNQEAGTQPHHTLKGATIPAALAALYAHAEDEEARGRIAAAIKKHPDAKDIADKEILHLLFGSRQQAVCRTVAEYSGVTPEAAATSLAASGRAGLEGLRHHLGDKAADGAAVARYLMMQRKNILEHLPAQLQLGRILEKEDMEDVVHKMSGPFSSVIQKIGEIGDASSGNTRE